MMARGHQVSLLCPPGADIAPAARQQRIDVITLPIEKKNLTALLAMRGWMARQIGAYDVVNTHSSTDSWLAALAARLIPRCRPIVRTRHVSTAVNRSRATRWLYQTATCHIVTTGEALRQQLYNNNNFALDTMTSVPTGIDLERFRPLERAKCRQVLGLDPDAKLMGIVATLRDWKGHVYLFEAFAKLSTELDQWYLLVVGDGPYEAALRAKVAELGLGQRVQFVGRQNNVPEWLSALNLFVLPSYGDEGVPQAITQAMACGLPVISTPIGSIGEAVIHGVTGLLVAPKDSAALAQALGLLAGQPQRRDDFGQAGLVRARDLFGIERMLDDMEVVFFNAALST